jgi:hypothetical protein
MNVFRCKVGTVSVKNYRIFFQYNFLNDNLLWDKVNNEQKIKYQSYWNMHIASGAINMAHKWYIYATAKHRKYTFLITYS